MPVCDQIADSAHVELNRLAKVYKFPDFVKQASGDILQPRVGIPGHLFADVVNRQFPCDDAASTWLSAVFFNEKRAEFSTRDQQQIESRLQRYIDYWRISGSVKAAKDTWAGRHKEAEAQLPDSDYAFVWAGSDGLKDRRLRIKTAAEVRDAARYLVQHRDAFTYEQRNTMAKKVLDKAIKLGAAIGDQREFLERQAGMGCCSPQDVINLIRHRANFVKNAEVKEHFIKMAKTIEDLPARALQPGMLIKLATTLDMLDRANGLCQSYEHGLARPEDVIFKATFSKTADVLQAHVALTNGNYYEKSALKKVALADLRGLLGNEIADAVATPLGEVDAEKMAELAATLPLPDAALFSNLLSDQGVAPILRKAASARQGMVEEEMQAWAEVYRKVGAAA